MSKEKFLRSYVGLSILVGVYYLLNAFLYLNKFPVQMYGLIDKSLFNITLFYNSNAEFVIFNQPLLVFLIFFVLNLVILVALNRYEKLENNLLEDVPLINSFITLLLIVGQILLFVFVPDQINGIIESNILFFKFPRLASDIVTAVNITFVFSFVYIVYNGYLFIRTTPKVVVEEEYFDEEEYIKNDTILKEIKEEQALLEEEKN